MHLLLILAAFVATAVSQEICCLPEEFEVDEVILGSNNRGGRFEPYVERRRRAYDFPKRRTAVDGEINYLNGTRNYFKLVENYEEGSFWFIEDKKCVKQALRKREHIRCVVNETFVGSFYVGDKQVFVDEWSQRIEHESERGFETREFIRGSCIPFKNTFIGEATEGGTKVEFTRVGSYGNFIKGADPRFFELPSYCPK